VLFLSRLVNLGFIVSISLLQLFLFHYSAETDSEALMKELYKKGDKGSQQVKLLLKKTAIQRRNFVVDAENCQVILDKFPHMGNFDMVSNVLENENIKLISHPYQINTNH
jgi:hypothetical protein